MQLMKSKVLDVPYEKSAIKWKELENSEKKSCEYLKIGESFE